MLSLEDVLPLHLADLTFPDAHPLHGQQCQVYAFAIRHESGVVLFETGIGRGNASLDRAYQVRHLSLMVALEAHEIRLDDVRAVVNSHLHFDHCGGNSLFPGVPIYVQTAEYRAARATDYTVRSWVDFPDAHYRQVEGDLELATGMRLLSTPGHTPGHQSLLLETAAGLVVLAGQAVYSAAEYNHVRATDSLMPEDPPPDPERYRSSVQRIIELNARRVWFSHDAKAWDGDSI